MTDDIKCPVCGSLTKLRTSKRDGSKFHVCVNYPKCKGQVAFEDEFEEAGGDNTPNSIEKQPKLCCPKCGLQVEGDEPLCSICGWFSPIPKQKGDISFLEFVCFFVLIISLCALVYYWLIFDTTVPVPGLADFGVSRVNNEGLMHQQQNGIIVSGIFAVLSSVGIMFGMYNRKK